LLEKGSTPKGRDEIAAKSGLPAAQVLKFVNYATSSASRASPVKPQNCSKPPA
jgi:hypothetical protein